MRVLLLTRYSQRGASSRLRHYQYLPYLESQGISVDALSLFGEDYLLERMGSGNRSIRATFDAYSARFRQVLNIADYDLNWMQNEVFPWIPYWLERLVLRCSIPYVVEYDDAVFHRYDDNSSSWVSRLLRGKVAELMKMSAAVIVGNRYIADYAERAGAGLIVEVPTAVDLRRYVPAQNDAEFTVGWIGTSITLPYVEEIVGSLRCLAESGPLKFVIIGAPAPEWSGIDVSAHAWSEDKEVELLNTLDVGVMPLPDEPWERGKCGYKLIQYMACAKPVVASPVGVNSSIVTDEVGYLANDPAEWLSALTCLRADPDLRLRMGLAARERVENRYCMDVTAPLLAETLRQAAT